MGRSKYRLSQFLLSIFLIFCFNINVVIAANYQDAKETNEDYSVNLPIDLGKARVEENKGSNTRHYSYEYNENNVKISLAITVKLVENLSSEFLRGVAQGAYTGAKYFFCSNLAKETAIKDVTLAGQQSKYFALECTSKDQIQKYTYYSLLYMDNIYTIKLFGLFPKDFSDFAFYNKIADSIQKTFKPIRRL